MQQPEVWGTGARVQVQPRVEGDGEGLNMGNMMRSLNKTLGMDTCRTRKMIVMTPVYKNWE